MHSKNHFKKHFKGSRCYRHNRGVVLIVALVVLVILVISSVGLMRSVDGSMTQSGAVAFKRDAANVTEQTLAKILTMFESGQLLAFDLNNGVATQADDNTINYSAKLLTAVTPDGIPNIMLDTSAFDAAYAATPAAFPTVPAVPPSMRVRYLIERMCTLTGTSDDPNKCIKSAPDPVGMGAQNASSNPAQPQYRVTIKVESTINDALVSYVQAIIGYRKPS